MMTGAESVVRTLTASGVDVCFCNPGTSEMHFVAALDRHDGMRTILGLFEGVVTGAADGYGRMAGKPAATLLHLGPGLANGLANLHNAKRAATPIVTIVGDHATFHGPYDTPISMDIRAIAAPVSAWVDRAVNSRSVAFDAARAVQAARRTPGGVATLIVPADAAWQEAEGPAAPLPVPPASPVPGDAIDAVARALSTGRGSALILGGKALTTRGLKAAGRIAAKTGARLLHSMFAARLARGAGIVAAERLPYFPEQQQDFLKDFDQLILIGEKPPVSLFAYPGKQSWCVPEGCRIHQLAGSHEDGVAALEALAETLNCPEKPLGLSVFDRAELPTDKLNAYTIGKVIAHFLPEHAIISDESGTSGLGVNKFLGTTVPHDHLALTGGSIGQGIPVATGAAVACPDRKVVCLQGDGGGMFTLQALWTQAHEDLDVTTIIFANRSYAILNMELERVGEHNPGPKARSMLDLRNPDLDWVMFAQGMGVEASRAATIKAFAAQFADAMTTRRPRLIEVVL